MTSAAIITTLRNAAGTMGSFVAWHRASGFRHFFLFFDDPSDALLEWARTQADITAIPCDDALRQTWQGLQLWAEAGPHIGREVMARQLLNAEHAMTLARAQGLDWLLHIDADELFYAPGIDAGAHFATLPPQADAAAYINYEAVPEVEDTGDFFRTVTLFKRPLDAAPWPEAQALITRAGQNVEAFFHFYGNGKSAVRLSSPGMLPINVHAFARRTPSNIIWNRGPFILHYPCCGFVTFWQKYLTLGRFPDTWWGTMNIADAVGPFHLQARDGVMDAMAGNDPDYARRFFRDRLMITDPVLIGAMIRHGLLERITAPQKVLLEHPAV